MKTTRRIMGLLLAFALLLPGLPIPARAARIIGTGSCGGDVIWTLTDDGVLTISGSGDMWNNQYPTWSSAVDQVLHAKIEYGVTNIGSYFFRDAYNLQTVEVADSVTYVGAGAFRNCYSLQCVEFAGNAPEFGKDVFENTVTTCHYPANDPTWTYQVLHDHEGDVNWVRVGEVNWPITGQCGDNVTWTLDGEGLLTISGTGATWDYPIEYPEWFTYMWVGDARSVVVEDGVTAIGECFFCDCYPMERVQLAASVTSLGAGAFGYCLSLMQVDFLGDAPAFGSDAFYGTVTTCSYPAGNPTWTEDVRQNYSGDLKWTASGEIDWPLSGTCGGDVTWTLDEAGLLTISGTGEMDDFFTNNAGWYGYTDRITAAVVEEGVTSLGDYTFRDCTGMASLSLPATLTSVGKYVFMYCENTIEVRFQGDAPTFDQKAFQGNNLNCYYPADNQTWRPDCRQSCGGQVVWTAYDVVPPEPDAWPLTGQCGDNVSWALHEDGLMVLSGSGDTWAFPEEYPQWHDYADRVRRVVIESGVSAIGDYLFCDCVNLEQVQVDPSVVRVGVGAFANCQKLTAVDFLGDAPVFGQAAFAGTAAVCTYPAGNATWTAEVRGSYGGELTWLASGQTGDLNGSGAVDSDDAIYLLYHTLFGGEQYPVSGDCDYNHNGTVDSDDAIYLLYHTLFGDLYPLS